MPALFSFHKRKRLCAFLAIAGNAVWGQTTTTIDVSASTSTGGEDQSYTFSYDESGDSRVLTIKNPGDYTINNASGVEVYGNKSNVQIKITEAGTYNITLDNVKINAYLGNELDGTITDGEGLYPERCAFEIGSGVIVNLDWKGTNNLWSGPQRAGINVKEGAKLVLKGTNSGASLEVGSYGNSERAITYGAGIGGDKNDPDFGTIIIESGSIKAYSRAMGNASLANGAGIGGGYSDSGASSSGTIIIKGGDVTAQCNVRDYYMNGSEKGAGIGGGNQGTCDQIVIIGGANEDATKTTVSVQSYSGADIGVGEGYTGSEQPEIIIGKWDEESTITVTESDNAALDVTDENYVDGYTENPSVTGNVTMPKGTQIYVEDLIPSGQDARFKAYNLNLTNSKIDEETDHSLTKGQDELKKAGYYYFGAGMSFDLKELACGQNHLFMGWISSDGQDIVSVDNNMVTFNMPSETPSGTDDASSFGVEKLYYNAVWVDNDYTIVVPSGKQWTAEGTETPFIYTAGIDSHLDKLTFAFSDDGTTTTYTSPTSGLFMNGNSLTFSNNKLIGTPTLPTGTNYLQEDIDAYVKLGENGIWKALKIHIRCAEEIVINSISASPTTHIYDGKPHNGLAECRGDDNDHLLSVTMADWGDSGIEATDLREGVHYRIASYGFNGETDPIIESDVNKSALITDAGTYSNVTVEAKDGVTFSNSLDADGHNSYTINTPITVNARQMSINLSFNKESIEEGTELSWENDVKIDIEPFNANTNRGLVTGEDIKISGTISYEPNEDGTAATVTITNIQIADGNTFKQSNYKLYVNSDQEFREDAGLEIVEDNVPIVQPSDDDNDRPGHIDRPAKYYNIYIDTVCPGLKLELSKDVVKEGGQVSRSRSNATPRDLRSSINAASSAGGKT